MTERLSTPRAAAVGTHADMKAVYRSSLVSPSDTEQDFHGSEDEDEVFFGPMTTVELRKMHQQRDIHRRSTQALALAPLQSDDSSALSSEEQSAVKIQTQWRGALARQAWQRVAGQQMQCATPEPSPLPLSAVQSQQHAQAAMEIQRLCRGFLARRERRRRRDDMQLLAMKGSISVERRRRMPRAALPESQIPLLPSMRIPRAPQSAPAVPDQQPHGVSGGLQPAKPAAPRAPPSMQLPVPVQPGKASNLRSPLRRGLSIRNWFQRQPPGMAHPEPLPEMPAQPQPAAAASHAPEAPKRGSPLRSNTLKVNHPANPHPPAPAHSGRARKYLGRLLATLRPKAAAAPPSLAALAEEPAGVPQGRRPAPPSSVSLASARRRQARPRSSGSQRDRRRHRRYRRGRDAIVGSGPAPRTRPHTMHTTNIHASLPPPPMSSSSSSLLAAASHILLVPIESSADNCAQQDSMRRLRSPPPAAPGLRPAHMRSDSSSSASRQSPSASSSSLDKQAVGTKLAMLKTSIGSFLARPLSPRVAPPPQPLSAIVEQGAAHGPSPLAAHVPMAIGRNRSVDNVAGAKVMLPPSAFARTPLSAVGGSFGHDASGSTSRPATGETETDEDVGIAASVLKIAPQPAAGGQGVPGDDNASVSSISSMSESESSLASEGSLLAAASDISMASSPLSPLAEPSGASDQMDVSLSPPIASGQPPVMPGDAMLLSPRLSLRLSADASSFGMGLSVFASLMDGVAEADDADSAVSSSMVSQGEAAADEKGEIELSEKSEAKPAERSSEPVENSTEPAARDAEPVENSSEPTENCTEPVENSSEPVENSTEPAARDAEPVENSSEPAETNPGPAETNHELVGKETAPALAPAPSSPDSNPMMERLRSLRSRQREKEAASKKPAALAKADAGGRRFRATQTAAQRSAKKKGGGLLGALGSLQLDRLTKLNTRRNSTYMTCEIELVVVTRHGDRPVSPSLLMQERTHERRITAELDSGATYHSIYSDSDSDPESDSDGASDSDHSMLAAGDMYVETRPLSPEPEEPAPALPEAADLPAAEAASTSSASLDAKRKSADLASAALPSPPALAANAPSKKQCVRRVQWGTRSVLQATWLQGRSPPAPARGAPKPVLVRRPDDNPDAAALAAGAPTSTKGAKAARRQSRNLTKVQVSSYQYPDSIPDDLLDDDEEMEEIGAEPESDEEFIPRRSTRSNRSKK
ncbi:hypothetical protein LPJ70_000007 [Coemansia sp. RSA 2708]|nr:hypothetical protein LPJ70_000007 [Coemansia sp. RSA 2708]